MPANSPAVPMLSAATNKRHVDRHQDGDRDQESDQQLRRRAVVFEVVAGDLGVRPQEAAHVGREPEPVDAERDREQKRAAQQNSPECLGLAGEADRPGRGHGGAAAGCGAEAAASASAIWTAGVFSNVMHVLIAR